MTLHEDSVKLGNWLFRWRSYLPLLFIFVLLPGLLAFNYPKGLHEYDLIWEMFCVSVSFLGLFIRCYTIGYIPKGTSGRNTRNQKADSLNIAGSYSLLRNPLYLGNFFMCLGVIMFVHLWWIILIYILVFWLYYERIIFAEEEFLKKTFGKQYQDYVNCTPAFIPKFKNWQSPNLPFSFRNVLKREYSSLFALISAFAIMEISSDYIVNKRIIVDKAWLYLFLVGFGIYITLMTLKKKTVFLHVEGR